MSKLHQIELIERKIVAQAKASSELKEALEEIKKSTTSPAPPVRRDLKKGRLQEMENFYTKLKLKKAI